MKQSKLMSWVETCLNTAVGFGISLAAQIYFLPLLGVQIAFHQNLMFAVIMTVISIARGFILRRLFEAFHIRRPLSPFMQAVVAERFRQIEGEGWSTDHDDREHLQGDLALAGASYALHREEFPDESLSLWPWSPAWYKPDGFRRNLVKGCALIIAEGEKFDRSKSGKAAR